MQLLAHFSVDVGRHSRNGGPHWVDINTGSNARGAKLGGEIEAFKAENENSSSPLSQKLAGRNGTSGCSLGGGGTTHASADDPSLLSSVAIMPWGPTRGAVTVPTIVICGASDSTASCDSHGTPFYGRLAGSVPKVRVTVSGGHRGQPSAGGGEAGRVGLAFQKVLLEGDERWPPCWPARTTTRPTSNSPTARAAGVHRRRLRALARGSAVGADRTVAR